MAVRKGALTWFALATLIGILVILVLAPNPWLRSVVERERQLARTVFSAPSVLRIDARAQRWYGALIRDTGIEASLYAFAGRDADGTPPRRGVPAIDSRGALPYLEGRVDATLLLARQMLWRSAAALTWTPLLALLLVPAVLDGVTAWRIRRHGFRFASPLAHRYAWRLQGGILIGFLFALALPLPLPPLATPAAMSLLAVAVALSLTHMPKRI